MSQPKPYGRHPWAGAFSATLGIGLVLVAAGVVPTDPASFYAPRWVLGVCGGVAIVAGVMIVLGDRPRMRDALAALLLLGMGAIGAEAALFSDPEHLSGGLPFLSREANVVLTRVVFGCGSLICLGLAVYAGRLAWRGKRNVV